MKPTGMPVYRLTEDCIWNSFRSSGKRHLILTGDRGSGKSTLLSGLLRKLSSSGPVPGVTTWAEPGQAVYLRENISEETVQVGRFDPLLPGRENRMRPLPEGFQEAGVRMLGRLAEQEGEWASIDEIGYLESGCADYCDAVRRLMERKRLAAAVRRQDLPFLTELCGRPDVFLVDLDVPFGKLGCVIMASGLGKRFGGNKLMAELKGKPLIQYALDATEGIFERRVVVTRHKEVEELCRRQGVPVVFHSLPYRSDTVRLGLESLGAGTDAGKSGTETEIKIAPPAENGLEGCMFCPGDQPMLGRETVASLALCAASGKNTIWRAVWNGQEGSPVLFPAWVFPELLALPEGKGGGFAAGKHRELVRTVSARSQWELKDVDCLEDLELLAEKC
ncbi:NTP transferase domain-containing protein [Lachnoclostridium sp. An138]|uniref:NTP transferase domain-containing protein n=1 Tax=Lachnoclostridium sp. An138 TaxID=1965560 RepID=UPI000B387A51|nr:NTP transferase domain-containing protein [Lachnoclostridium sp. An138]